MAKRWTFEEWMAVIDGLLSKKLGVESSDLPDLPYRDWHDDGLSPSRAASRAARSAGECC